MGTVSKALSLLDFFDGDHPELALADAARRSGFDKATTRRLLLELAEHGIVEQNPATKGWRIGPGALRLARLRADQFPLIEVARPVVEDLVQECGETVHMSELVGGKLSNVLVVESARAIRVSLPSGQILPFNCTASGLALIAFGPPEIRKTVMKGPLRAVTTNSITDPVVLAEHADRTRERGYAIAEQGFEEGVVSVAAPLLALDGVAFGALSIATPSHRISSDVIEAHGDRVRTAASRIRSGLFGEGRRP